MVRRYAVAFGSLWLLSGLFLSSCLLEEDSGSESGTEVEIVPNEQLDPGSLVCDALGDEDQITDSTQGVVGQLYYLQEGQPEYSQVSDYLAYGNLVDHVTLYFNQIYVPTRPFDRGFVTLGGHAIQTEAGDTLYEWFALALSGRVRLADGDNPGLYQFAILSDDGAVLRMGTTSGGLDLLIDNDGNHPTRMGCATEPVDIQPGDKIPFELDYHQGPRFHIALTVLWREWMGDPSDPECGEQGNSRFFDSTLDPPEPQQSYHDLLARGWKPLRPENYMLPATDNGDDEENPCNAPAPSILEVTVAGVSSQTATVNWFTDIPATSQVQYTNQKSGEVLTTVATVDYVTHHGVELSGLQPNTIYNVKVISASTSGLSSESSEILFRTAR